MVSRKKLRKDKTENRDPALLIHKHLKKCIGTCPQRRRKLKLPRGRKRKRQSRAQLRSSFHVSGKRRERKKPRREEGKKRKRVPETTQARTLRDHLPGAMQARMWTYGPYALLTNSNAVGKEAGVRGGESKVAGAHPKKAVRP